LNLKNEFSDIATHPSSDISVSLSHDNKYYVWGHCKGKSTSIITVCNSFNEVFLNYTSLQYEPSDRLIEFEDKLFRFGYYDKEYKEIEYLGRGSYSTVFKVDKQGKLYAVKKIVLKKNQETAFFKEFSNYSVANRLQNSYVVEHYYAWFENNKNDSDIKLTLYIKTELCDKTLKVIIKEIQSDPNFRKGKILTPIGYYIASSLFLDILNGVQYLHDNDIIHRDLKPDNILLKRDKNCKSFIKIADFGLSVLHKFSEQSHSSDVGTPRYMAPEVMSNKKYNFKADINSLEIIFEDLLSEDLLFAKK
jgi:serine/threonine protein kinase